MRLTLCVVLCVLSSTLRAAEPASTSPPTPTPTSSPADGPALTERQQSLLLQLSDAEANIKALNMALTRAGYKVGQAYDRIDSNLGANELMDRKGGGPVGWKDFYGKTAREYDRNLYWDRRPQQFQKLYDANNNQIARAKEQVAALGQDQATLLARRQKHEADQARLWATLAFERVKDREIAEEPICRFKLKGNGSPDPRVDLLRPFVVFLRAADRAAVEGDESVKTDAAATFAGLSPRMGAAYAALRAGLADALLAGGLKDEDKTRADGLKTLCKQLAEECAVIADNSQNALDREKAKEDNSKLQFRARLQESLAKFASGVGELDAQVGETARTWGVTPQPGVPTGDVVAAAPAGQGARAPQPAAQAVDGEWIKLLDPSRLGQWAHADGKLELQPNSKGFVTVRNTAYWWGAPVRDAVIRAKVHKISGANLSLALRRDGEGFYTAWYNGGPEFGIGKRDKGKKYVDLISVKIKPPPPNFVLEFSAVGDVLILSVDGKEIVRARDKALQSGTVGIGAFKGIADFDQIELRVLDTGLPVKP